MKIEKWILGLLVALCLMGGLMPSVALAQDTNNDGYHDGDVAVINAIIDTNGLRWEKNDITGWNNTSSITWNDATPKRIRQLNLFDHSLTGTMNVGGLTNLQGLNCSDNSLTTLDVGGLTNLHELYCHNNKLTGLDVAGFTNLQGLFCYDNSLTGLDVSGLANLQILTCHNNSLASLDISGTVLLVALTLQDNPLTSFTNRQGYTLTANAGAGGSVSITDCSFDGRSVTLTATANPNHAFDRWTGSLTGSVNPVTFTLDSHMAVAASFFTQALSQPGAPPVTGDDALPGLWLGAAMLSIFGLAGSLAYSRRKRKAESE